MLGGKAKASSTDLYTLRIPLQSGSGGRELLLQNISDDLAWFDHLVSVNTLGQVNIIPRFSDISR